MFLQKWGVDFEKLLKNKPKEHVDTDFFYKFVVLETNELEISGNEPNAGINTDITISEVKKVSGKL